MNKKKHKSVTAPLDGTVDLNIIDKWLTHYINVL